jgi:ribosomal protein S18 acetylase RimI-like enzyme
VCFDGRVELFLFGALTDEHRAQLEGDEHDPFDAAGIELAFRPKDRHVGIRDEDGRLLASAGFVLAEVEVEVEGEVEVERDVERDVEGDRRARFGVLGIGGVIVAAAHRGRGLARAVVEAALTEGARLGPEYALLFCHEDRSGLYRKLGFEVIESPLEVLQPRGTAVLGQLAMWRSLSATGSWPPGAAVLQSLPF